MSITGENMCKLTDNLSGTTDTCNVFSFVLGIRTAFGEAAENLLQKTCLCSMTGQILQN